MTLPSDVKLVFDLAKPSDAKEAAALGDAENFVRAIAYGIVKQDAGDAAYKFYSVPLSNAQSYAKDQIQQHIDNGYTITGTRRLTHGKVVMASNGTQASVSFCEDDSKFYGREVKTRKIHVTAPSANDYYYFEIVMTASTGHKGLWTAEAIEVQGKATQCKA
ncbi:hypothetical protein OK074_7847 [Actinobacteria bacterium OK074]|nr:hypothetical protein OK074_7847 [Actinobacteria bacterium OK074]